MTVTEGLCAAYRGIVCDLDGVVYRGSEPVEHAVASLTAARDGLGIVYATNNASRTVEAIAVQLSGLGLPDAQIITSAQAGAQLIADECGSGATVLAVGGDGVTEALAAAGLHRVGRAGEAPVAVLQGWAREVRVEDLAQAAMAIRAGAAWFATNTDLTLPTAQGPIPGNGTLVAAVQAATDATPRVVGKPEPPLYLAAAARLGVPPERLLGIGDRLATDIVGAARAGLDSLWVLTGVDGFAALARSDANPTYAAADLRALHRPYPRFVESVTEHGPAVGASGGVTQWRVGGLTARSAASAASVDLDETALGVDANTVAAWGLRLVCGLRDGSLGPQPHADRVVEFGARLDELFDRVRRHTDRRAGE